MTENFTEEEYKKCLESPLYWYNNYCIINGKKVEPLTQEQWDARLSEINYQRHRRYRNPEAYMKTFKECYELLPNFIQDEKNR